MENNFYTVRGYQLLEQHKNWLTPSLEDYLEMVCRLLEQDGSVRISLLAKDLNVRPSSASKMILKLAQLGFVDYEKYGVIKLTEKGAHLGQYLLWRHQVLSSFFDLLLSGSQEDPFVQVELTEHELSPKTVERLDQLTRFFQDRPYLAEDLKRNFDT